MKKRRYSSVRTYPSTIIIILYTHKVTWQRKGEKKTFFLSRVPLPHFKRWRTLLDYRVMRGEGHEKGRKKLKQNLLRQYSVSPCQPQIISCILSRMVEIKVDCAAGQAAVALGCMLADSGRLHLLIGFVVGCVGGKVDQFWVQLK